MINFIQMVMVLFRSLDKAMKHFDKLSNKFIRKVYIGPKSTSISELIITVVYYSKIRGNVRGI